MQFRITGGRLVDHRHFDGIAGILIEDGKIAAIIESGQIGEQDRASNIQQPGTRIFDASDKIVTPV
jgi:imidazolonepropionase-like amidohydrolase